ncbi:hypothetical protein [Ekhidna sp.]|uniref:hypothetical protein n=1 Tax=Ekhidna sp. TaxID=2608089 RepID=UPI003516876C
MLTIWSQSAKRVALLTILSVVSKFSQSQENKFDFVPPSPNASALGEYGAHPVDLSSGAVNVNIPIYQFKAGDITIPISLSHRTTGLKVDQTESWAGLGWELNAGGVVTRTIYDEVDEEAAMKNEMYPYPEDMSMDNFEALQYISKEIEDDGFDTQIDEYSYNFNGYTGKFVFDRNGIPKFIPKTNLLVEKSFNSLGNGEVVFTTPDGIKYFFGGDYEEISYMESTGLTGCSKTFDRRRVTAWYLYKVVSPKGTTVHLEYTPTSYTYPLAVQQSKTVLQMSEDQGCSDGEGCEAPGPVLCASQLNMDKSQVLSRIYSDGIGEVVFNISYSVGSRLALLNDIYVKDELNTTKKHFSFEYEAVTPTQFSNPDFSDPLDRYFLTAFYEKNPSNGEKVSAHQFNYIDKENIPPRLSYAQDHWGYFNGKSNSGLLPKTDDSFFIDDPNATADRSPNFSYAVKGALRSITYPTGGTTTFFYEPNYVEPIGTVFNEDKEIRTNLALQGEFNQNITKTIYSAKDQLVDVTAILKPLNPPNPNAHTIKEVLFKIINESTGQPKFQSEAPVLLYQDYDYNYYESSKITLVAGEKYTVQIISDAGEDVEMWLAVSYISDVQQILISDDVKAEAGGMRIKKMIDDPGVDDSPIVKKYDYTNFSNSKSSAEIPYVPYYFSTNRTIGTCFSGDEFGGGIVESTCDFKSLHGKSVLPLTNNSGSHITYRNVTILHGENAENGKEEITFRTMSDSPGRIVHGNDIPGSPHSNGWGNGLETKREIFGNQDGSFVLKKRITHGYGSDDAGFDNIKSLVVRDHSSPIKRQFVYDCDETNVEKVYYARQCVKKNYDPNHEHSWASSLFGPTKCIGGDMQDVAYGYHPCYGDSIGSQAVDHQYFDNINILEYYRRSFWFYDTLKTEEVFDEHANVLTIVHDYEYDNPEHRQLSRYILTRSDGSQTTEYHYYPHDYNENLTEYNISGLKDGNFRVPIKTEKTVAGQLVSGNVVVYNDKGQPVKTYQYRNSDLITREEHDPNVYLPNFYELSMRWQYNEYGNLAEFKKNEGDKSTAFIWGFDGKFPVAKLENTTASQLEAIGIDLAPSGNLPASSVAALSNLPPESLITIYEYDPIYGLIKVTDPNQRQTKYEYDELGRLKQVIEVTEDGENILNVYSYHYNSK